MTDKAFRRYSLFALLAVLLLCAYPIYMGAKVGIDMLRFGAVAQENYPKYVIPYTPIAAAVIAGTALMPAAVKFCGKYAQLSVSVLSSGVFFAVETLLEHCLVTVTEFDFAPLEKWQWYMCAVSPTSVTKTNVTVETLLAGDLSPAFRIHFYLISLLLVLGLLGIVFGFARRLTSEEKPPLRPLILQTVSVFTFLGMCIWACFTAFYRTGEIIIAPFSAVLMTAFFLLLGLVAGTYLGSFLQDKAPAISVLLPSVLASLVTLAMYFGEITLLHGRVYRFGHFFLFEDVFPHLILSPFDFLTILLSGALTFLLFTLVSPKKRKSGKLLLLSLLCIPALLLLSALTGFLGGVLG